MKHIYERLLLKELFKVMALFTFSFYFLYILIDYSANLRSLTQEGLKNSEVFIYYLLQFIKQAELLFPLAFLIAAVKVLTSMNLRNELIALLASGVAMKRLLRPFFHVAFVIALLLFVNFQWCYPFAASRLSGFEHQYFKANSEHLRAVHHFRLQDNSLLLYNSYDNQRGAFSDVYWIVNADEIYRMKHLFPFGAPPRGWFVDHLTRDGDMQMRKKESFVHYNFPQVKFSGNSLFEEVNPPQWQSLKELALNLWKKADKLEFKKMNNREASLASHFYYRLTIPFLSLLLLVVVAPFCLVFRRDYPLFTLYALSILGCIAFLILTSSMNVLGESQVLPPFWACFTPYVLLFTLFGYRYARL